MKDTGQNPHTSIVGLAGLLSVEYHKRCRDCGRFLRKAEWVKKTIRARRKVFAGVALQTMINHPRRMRWKD